MNQQGSIELASVPEPSGLYVKAKRYLIGNAGIVLLLIFVGVKSGKASLGVEIESPQFLSFIFLFIMVYYFFQLSLFWPVQSATVRNKFQYKSDHLLSICIAIGTAICFIWFEKSVSVLSTDIIKFLVSLFLILTAILIQFIGNFSVSTFLHNQSSAENKIIDDLIKGNWILIFNKSSYFATKKKSGFKKISFDATGDIGEGANANEARWRLQSGLLEILNSDGKIFSRFEYNEKAKNFTHTNDPDTISLRDQMIVDYSKHSSSDAPK